MQVLISFLIFFILGRSYDDEIMMEDGHTDPASEVRHTNPIIVNNLPAAVTLLQSSSICDMETDSQPSLEVGFIFNHEDYVSPLSILNIRIFFITEIFAVLELM